MLRRLRSLLRNRRGAVAVEFAIIGPIVIAAIVGTMEVSRYYFVRNAMNNAVDEAARYATLSPTPTDTQITTRFRQQALGAIPDTGPNIAITRGTFSTDTQWINISVTWSMQVNFLFFQVANMPVNASRRVYSAKT